MLVNWLGSMREISPAHSKKLRGPILVNDCGSTRDGSSVQNWKAPAPISVNVSGSTREVRLQQQLNTPVGRFWIFRTPLGITRAVKEDLFTRMPITTPFFIFNICWCNLFQVSVWIYLQHMQIMHAQTTHSHNTNLKIKIIKQNKVKLIIKQIQFENN